MSRDEEDAPGFVPVLRRLFGRSDRREPEPEAEPPPAISGSELLFGRRALTPADDGAEAAPSARLTEPDPSIMAWIDELVPAGPDGPARIGGWAVDPALPIDRKLVVIAFWHGFEIGSGIAHRSRGDLQFGGDTHYAYSFPLARPVTPADLASGAVRLEARSPRGAWAIVRAHWTVTAAAEMAAAATTIARLQQELQPHEFRRVAWDAYNDPQTTEAARTRLILPRTAEANAARYAEMARTRRAGEDVSPLLFPVGLKSGDDAAILGRDGYVFVLAGTNLLIDQYAMAPDDPRVTETAARWTAILAARRATVVRPGRRFVQIMVPDKSSVVPECFPMPIEAPTPLLRAIEQAAADPAVLGEDYISGHALFTRDPRRFDTVRRCDSHLAPYGAWTLFAALLARLGLAVPPAPAFTVLRLEEPDLAYRFFGLGFYEEVAYAEDAEAIGHAAGARKVAEHLPDGGRHMSRSQIWENDSAPYEASVLVFGNSFCGFAEQGQAFLSWWFARFFRRYQFVWSAAIDHDLIEQAQPDIVVGQALERFLPEVPTA